MKKFSFCCIIILILHLLTACGATHPAPNPTGGEPHICDLLVNYKSSSNALGSAPHFSWQMAGDNSESMQSAYQILLADSTEALSEESTCLWTSDKVSSGISVSIPYEGEPLASASDYYWTVRVWDQNDTLLETTETGYFRTGLAEADWQNAKWISSPQVSSIQLASAQSINADKTSAYEVPFEGTISYRIYCKDSTSAFFWGAQDSYYGDYYRFAIDSIGDQVSVQLANMHYEDVTDQLSIPLEVEDPTSWEQEAHEVSLLVTKSTVTASIDGTLIGDYTLSRTTSLGSIGFWTTRGYFKAYYDDLLIQTEEGVELIHEDFEDAENTIFAPYFCRIEKGDDYNLSGNCLLADSGFLITPDSMLPAPMLRKDFTVDGSKDLQRALLYSTALGSYDLYINGACVADSYFSPGQSQYDTEVYYRTYDVTKLLSSGDNTLAAILGHGRYNRAKSTWGDALALCQMLALEYEDGSVEYVVTDDSWQCYLDGPIRNDDMYAGEFYDCNKVVDHWSDPQCDTSAWEAVSILSFDGKQAEPLKAAAISPENVCIETIHPVSVSEPVPGTYVCDFGDNLTGMCSLSFKGEAGKPVVLRYAEKLNEDNFVNSDGPSGTIWTEGLYTAKNTDYCIPSTTEVTTYQPRLVYRGFRFVQITGVSNPITPDDISALVISADNKRTGTFNCSNESINTLYNAIYRTQRNNYVDIPTDCPQRDERFGWAGDAQVFAHTAAYNDNTHDFIQSFLHSLVLAQRESGAYPDLMGSFYENGGSNGWADAGIILTWELYRQFGDKQVIEDNLDSMCTYMDYLVETSEDFIRPMDSYSDHIAESLLEDDMCNTAECAYVADLLAKMCEAIGRDDLNEKYRDIFNSYKNAWQTTFMNEDGTVGSWMQSEYVLPLAFHLYPDELAQSGADYLNMSVEGSAFHPTTGYVATPWLLPVLCEYGYAGSAYNLIEQNTFPSWNYMFSHGNTTLTESFHTYRDNEDGTYSINGSLNHYALGSVGAWLYNYVLGIQPDDNNPGYKHFYLKPAIHSSLSFAEGSYDSVYGLIESKWSLEGSTLTYECTVPLNTTATLTLPAPDFEAKELMPGHHEFTIELQ